MSSALRRALIPLLLLALSGCQGRHRNVPDGGSDGGLDPIVSANGQVRIYPPGAAYLQASGHPLPSIGGRLLTVEEPLRAALADPSAVYGQQVVDGGGQFSVGAILSSSVAWALGALVQELDGGYPYAQVAPAVSVLYDVGVAGQPPDSNVDGGWAELVPVQFVNALETSVGTGRIGQIADAGGPGYLLLTGYVTGQVLVDGGAPLAGAQVVISDPSLDSQLFYPNATFTGTLDGGTSSTGIYVLVHNGGPPRALQLSVAGHLEILPHDVVAASGVGYVSDLSPTRCPSGVVCP